jgi:hypothetical protein
VLALIHLTIKYSKGKKRRREGKKGVYDDKNDYDYSLGLFS